MSNKVLDMKFVFPYCRFMVNTKQTRYQVTKQFNSGILAGLTFEVNSPVPFVVGREYAEVLATGSFTVTACTEVQ